MRTMNMLENAADCIYTRITDMDQNGYQGPVSYTVLLGAGKLVRRHVAQLFSVRQWTTGRDTGPIQEGDRVLPTTEQESSAP